MAERARSELNVLAQAMVPHEVAVCQVDASYPASAPWNPEERYPEHPFDVPNDAPRNSAYRAVRGALELLGLDAEGIGKPSWNPLGQVVRPGDTVVLKPNFVRDFRESNPDNADCVITHGAVIRAAIDYVYIALQGSGRIVVADAPQNDAGFDVIRRLAGLDEIRKLYRDRVGFEIEVYDLRPEAACKVDGVIVGHTKLAGDPAGYVCVNLGERSEFSEVNDLCHLLYGSEYDMAELHTHQHDDVHEYMISRTVLDADCVISLPKFKTHKKVGLTVNLKNLVGINGNKNWLPHHREGTPSQGGDQFADDRVKNRVERRAVAQFKRLFPLLGPIRPLAAGPLKALGKRLFGDTSRDRVRSGNWYGNDTTWRMTIDLNRILYYADREGAVHPVPVRRFFSIVDGIIAGEGNGPLDPTPRRTGMALAGLNPVAVDMACARLMGFDYRRLPMLTRALRDHPLPLAQFAYEDLHLVSNNERYQGAMADMKGPLLGFRPHFGWVGHVELATADEAGAVA